jgi:hypothetical protein
MGLSGKRAYDNVCVFLQFVTYYNQLLQKSCSALDLLKKANKREYNSSFMQ